MKKTMRRYVLIFAFIIFSIAFVSCSNQEDNRSLYYEPESIQQMNYEVDSDYYFDEEGNLLVPFDIAYKEAFENGEVLYDENTLLIKFNNMYDGRLTRNLKSAGIASLEFTMMGELTVWYEATIKEGEDILEVMSLVRSLDEVLVADYNYLSKSEEIVEYPEVQGNPMLESQWYLSDFGIEDSWTWLEQNGYEAGGSSSVVVAVIDTGVDYNHIDLAANMWVNTGEIAGNGIDDDDNGYVDDIHGANVVSDDRFHSGDPMDDHGHGTHVAGIIAAANNNEGIVGIAYNTKIMAIKAGQASGYFSQADIAEAILYAYDMGADVINMSFGGSGMSIAVQDALMTAYTRSVLVASAGNSGLPNEPVQGWIAVPNYPAAYSYVIGVMSVNSYGMESAFTNWDVTPFNSIEYEVYAPGEQILSTIPNDSYAAWSGTSMSAPVVSAMAAILRSVYSDRDLYPNKFIMGQIIATSEDQASCLSPQTHKLHNIPMIVNLYEALTKLPKPDVNLYNYYIFDSESIDSANNGDGIIDAGETIDIGMVLRNRWGMSENTVVTIDAISGGGVENPYVTFIKNDIEFNSVGTYSTKDLLTREGSIVVGLDDGHRILIDENTPNDTIIRLNVHGSCENALDPDDETNYGFEGVIELVVRNGYILPNIIDEDMTLTKDNYYIIPNSMIIKEGATVIVEPGTKIQFWTDDPNDPYADTAITYLKVEGQFITQGTEEEMVEIFPSELMAQYRVYIYESNKGYVELNYTEITNGQLVISKADHVIFRMNYLNSLWFRYLDNGEVKDGATNMSLGIEEVDNSIFYVLGSQYSWYKPSLSGTVKNSIFVNSAIQFNGDSYFENCVFLKNNTVDYNVDISSSIVLNNTIKYRFDNIFYNNITGKTYISVSRINDGYFNRSDVDPVKQFAEYLGGDLFIAETEAEWLFVKQNFGYSTYFSGLMYDNKDLYWADGTEIGDFFHFTKDPSYTGYHVIGWDWDLYEGASAPHVLIELDNAIYVDSISLTEYETELDLESTYQINASVSPTTADLEELIYISDDENVVTVNETGLITPVSFGNATVYVYSKDYNRQAAINVSVVEQIPLISLNAVLDNYQMSIDTTEKIYINFNPINTTQKNLIFNSSNQGVATVDIFGNINALSVGTTSITVTSNDGLISDSFELTVVSPVTSIVFTESTYVTNLTSTGDDIMPLILPLDATNKNITWQSSNPEVAYVDSENNLVKLQNGVTTIVATVENTDLSAELIVSINYSYVPGEVIEMTYAYNSYIALYSDGNLYYWGHDVLSPKLLDLGLEQKIIDFSLYRNMDYLVLVMEDHTIEVFTTWDWLYYGNELSVGPTNVDNINYITNVVKVDATNSNNSLFFLKTDGSVWAIGQNEYGQLGDGSKTDRSQIVQVLVNDIIDIAIGYYHATFIDVNGNLYLSGGGEENARISTPIIIKTGISEIGSIENNYYTYAKSVSDIFLYYSWDNDFSTPYRQQAINGIDYLRSSSYFSIRDGVVYVSGSQNNFGQYGIGIFSNTSTIYEMLKIDNATKLYIFDNNTFIQTEDGKFYGTGKNTDYELANFKNTNSAIPVRIFFGLQGNDGGFALELTNIVDNELLEDYIYLDFNEALVVSDNYVFITLKDSLNQNLAMYKDLQLDNIKIVPFNGWVIGETYTLTVPSNAFTTKFMVPNEQISYTFTYLGEQTPISLVSQNINEGDELIDQEIAFEFEFTIANESTHFGDIQIVDSLSNVETVNVTLDNNILTITGTLDYDDYTIIIPTDALADNMGGSNSLISVNFSVKQTIQLIDATHNDGDVREMVGDDIIFTFNVANQSTNFADIALLDEFDANIPITVTLIDNILTISPNSDLNMNATYRIFIPTDAVVDDLGNYNELISNTFTTYTPLEYIIASIDDYETNINPNQTIKLYFNYTEESTNFGNIQVEDESGNLIDCIVTLEDGILYIEMDGEADAIYTLIVPEGALQDELGVINDLIEIHFNTIMVENRFFYTTDYLQAWLDAFVESGLNTHIINSAILNNFNDLNVEHWLRMAANSGTYTDDVFETIGLGGNFWGTLNSFIINKQILDFDDYQELWNINEGDVLTVAPETAFPFVANLYITNADGEVVDTVGNETIHVIVEFNRDMDVTVPLDVRFGSSLPYAEYQISGSYETPRRWVGTYTLNTTIENGNQFFYIDNGHVEGDSWFALQPDRARFTFEIDTTGAQALIMQGVADETGIHLTWEQDDFETLAGYNVYRSTSEDGYYQRLNDVVIPSNIKTFFDDTVEPGVVYYYNFTVVKTDLTESIPSGKIVIMSLDTMAPNIYHTPIYQAYTGNNLIVGASITDNLHIAKATVYYRVVGETTWHNALMTNNNDRYSAIISSSYMTLDGLEYYIEAYDGVSYTYKGTEADPYVITIQQSVDQNDLGDVNNDGQITVLDALMVLQAINDRLNLTADEFLRADLDGSGTLEAWEALRILQYANGNITTIN